MEKTHQTILKVNLGALEKNIETYRLHLAKDTGIMAMVKAFGYGIGDVELARYMEEKKLVTYFGVAYPDEGVLLRQAGIRLPIMVMNPARQEIEALLTFDLEPTVFNLDFLKAYLEKSRSLKEQPPVHVKIDSGMHRLGFMQNELPAVLDTIKESAIKVAGVYTHLAATPEPVHDTFTHQQVAYLNACYELIHNELNYSPLKHVLNSAGVVRFPEYQYDMVRIGLGIYGLDPAEQITQKLTPVAELATIISQINTLKKGDTVGYSRKGVINENDQRIAVLPMGYADGYSRLFSNGNAEVYVNGHRAPVFGNVCMDMTFIDVTGIPCRPGDHVELFGAHITIQELAEHAQTITYEILTSIASRVKRVYS
jgi:alanine racemase